MCLFPARQLTSFHVLNGVATFAKANRFPLIGFVQVRGGDHRQGHAHDVLLSTAMRLQDEVFHGISTEGAFHHPANHFSPCTHTGEQTSHVGLDKTRLAKTCVTGPVHNRLKMLAFRIFTLDILDDINSRHRMSCKNIEIMSLEPATECRPHITVAKQPRVTSNLSAQWQHNQPSSFARFVCAQSLICRLGLKSMHVFKP